MTVELLVDVDRSMYFAIHLDVVSVHSEDLDRVDGGVLQAAFLLIREHVDAEDQSGSTGVDEVQGLIRPEEVVDVRLRVDG